MKYWIFKVNPRRSPPGDRRPDDPPAYSWDRLSKDRTVDWDWVLEAKSREQLKEHVAPGDQVVIYHTDGEWTVRGFAEVVGGWQTDGNRGWVTLEAKRAAKSDVGADVIEDHRRRFTASTRVSVIPIGRAGWDEIRRLAGL